MGPINVIIIVVGLFYFGLVVFDSVCSISDNMKKNRPFQTMIDLNAFEAPAKFERWKRHNVKVVNTDNPNHLRKKEKQDG